MVKMSLVFIVMGLFVVGSVCLIQEYKIPKIIAKDYDCENRPGIISTSNPAPFESDQHYINRHSKSIKKQIEEVCD